MRIKITDMEMARRFGNEINVSNQEGERLIRIGKAVEVVKVEKSMTSIIPLEEQLSIVSAYKGGIIEQEPEELPQEPMEEKNEESKLPDYRQEFTKPFRL